MKKKQKWFAWPDQSDLCPKDTFWSTQELNHMAGSSQEAIWSDHWVPVYINSVNLCQQQRKGSVPARLTGLINFLPGVAIPVLRAL